MIANVFSYEQLFCFDVTSVELAISPVFRRLCGFMIPSLLLAVVRASTQIVC